MFGLLANVSYVRKMFLVLRNHASPYEKEGQTRYYHGPFTAVALSLSSKFGMR